MGVRYLTRDEKKVLYQKYKNQGLENYDAWQKVRKLTSYLTSFVAKLKKKKLPEKTINEMFLEELAKHF